MIARSLLAAVLFGAAVAAKAQDQVLNVYSSRHYKTDEALYTGFTKATGIKVNLIEGSDDALIERVKNEGERSPADVLITVDAGRLWRATEAGLFQPVKSAVLQERIPAAFREPSGQWFGFSTRARVIAYNNAKVKPAEVPTYESLADPTWKGRVCVRSGSYIYSLSLLSAIIERVGEQQAETWAKAVKDNLARDPKGGDTDQIKAVAAGECDVAITNHYYYVRLARSENPEDKEVASKVSLVFPNQKTSGTHVNISGAGVLKGAKNRETAVKFLEYLTSDEAQRYFAAGNNEWPVVASAAAANPALQPFGNFKRDQLNVGVLGKNQPLAQKIYDRVGWK